MDSGIGLLIIIFILVVAIAFFAVAILSHDHNNDHRPQTMSLPNIPITDIVERLEGENWEVAVETVVDGKKAEVTGTLTEDERKILAAKVLSAYYELIGES